jgi:hypothetical protein
LGQNRKKGSKMAKKVYAGFKEGEGVNYQQGGHTILGVVAEGYDKPVDRGCVPVILITEDCVMVVPADSLTRLKK